MTDSFDWTHCHRCGRELKIDILPDGTRQMYLDEHIKEFHKEDFAEYAKRAREKGRPYD